MSDALLSDPHRLALEATAELMSRLRLQHAFVGSVARAAYLGGRVGRGSIDVIAVMNPEQKNQVAMMASHRGFRVDRDEVQETEELDLIPLHFAGPEEIRVHVLVASNALYGRMVAAGLEGEVGPLRLRVVTAEDLALLLSMAEDEESMRAHAELVARPDFDRRAYNGKLISIGLSELAIEE